jgi:hypothetical protein
MDVELMAQRHVFAQRPRQLVLEHADQRVRGHDGGIDIRRATSDARTKRDAAILFDAMTVSYWAMRQPCGLRDMRSGATCSSTIS